MLERLINQTNRTFGPVVRANFHHSRRILPSDLQLRFLATLSASQRQIALAARAMRLMARRCSTINSSIRYCALRPAPQLPKYRQAVGLSESCPKIGDVPKSPFSSVAALVPSAGTIKLPNIDRCFDCRDLLQRSVIHYGSRKAVRISGVTGMARCVTVASSS